MQCETVHYPDKTLMSYSSTFQGDFSYFFMDFRKDLKLVTFIKNLTFKNTVKVHNPLNITFFSVVDMDGRPGQTSSSMSSESSWKRLNRSEIRSCEKHLLLYTSFKNDELQ